MRVVADEMSIKDLQNKVSALPDPLDPGTNVLACLLHDFLQFFGFMDKRGGGQRVLCLGIAQQRSSFGQRPARLSSGGSKAAGDQGPHVETNVGIQRRALVVDFSLSPLG
jgi:hypothetical protein